MLPTDTFTLLSHCAEHVDGTLPKRESSALVTWMKSLDNRFAQAVMPVLETAPSTWEAYVDLHRAHRHPWYMYLADEIDIDSFAQFLLENTKYPSFTPMLERLRHAQFLTQSRLAIERNLADEQLPVPHSRLMRRLMLAVKTRSVKSLPLEVYDSLIDRTLVFYYGIFVDPWHLVGSLFATETMAQHRVMEMGRGLERVGLTPHELEFIPIHSDCDEQHAKEWLEDVILPSVAERPELARRIARGIAECLETSAWYLDDLLARAQRRDANRAHPSAFVPPSDTGAIPLLAGSDKMLRA